MSQYNFRNGLVSYWPLSQTGLIYEDIHNGFNMSGDASYTGIISSGGASFLDGSHIYIVDDGAYEIDVANPNFNVEANDFSIVFWYKTDAKGGIVSAIINQDDNGCRFLNQANNNRFNWFCDGTSQNIDSWSVNTWHYICIRTSGGERQVWTNGSNKDTNSQDIFIDSDVIKIGYAAGGYAHMMFFNRYITDDEMIWLYNGGSGRSYEEIVPPSYNLRLQQNTLRLGPGAGTLRLTNEYLT